MSQRNFDPASEHCLICGSPLLAEYGARAFDTADKAVVKIRKCGACSFAWQYPLGRSPDESREFFENSYNEAEQGINDYFDPVKKRQISDLELEFAAELPCTNKTLLDIGAGSGIFAQAAAEAGWAVTAVDPALDCARLLAYPTINAIKGTIDDIAIDSRFDVVTLWDVIEHAENPVDLIARAAPFVSENGWLLVETGNFKSVDRVYGGCEHWIYQLDHRWYFSPESIEKLLHEAGFTDLVFSRRVLRPGWQGKADYLGPSRISLLKSLLRQPLQIRKHLRLYEELIKAKTWEMPGIGIFAVAGRRSGKVD